MRRSDGFTLIELMVVVLIIGILIAVAVPVFNSSRDKAAERTCFANQRIIEGTAMTWAAERGYDHISELAGVITGGHQLVGPYILKQPPICPSAPPPADQMTADTAHGAYSLDNDGNVIACTHGTPPHGHYNN